MDDVKAAVERLLALSRAAATAVVEHDHASLAVIYEDIVTAGDRASGTVLALYDVAQAFMRMIARHEVSATARELSRFVREHPEGRRTLRRLLDGSVGVPADGLDRLIERGIVRKLGDRCDIRPGERQHVSDECDSMPLRAWRRVQRARSIAASSESPETQARKMAGLLGIDMEEVVDHLDDFPLEGGP